MSLNLISNYAANLANRITDQTDRRLTSTLTKLSTGSRITRASDDASGLVLGNTFRTELAALQTVQTNVAQASAMLQIADGAHQSVTDICIRMKALSVMCASQSLSDADRAAVDVEFQELKDEINRIALTTTFAGNVLTGGPGGGAPTKSFAMAEGMLPYFSSVKVYDPNRCTDDAANLSATVLSEGRKQFVVLTDYGRNVSQRIEVAQNKPLDFTALGIVVQPTSTFPAEELPATSFKSVTLGSTDGGVMHIDPGSSLSFIKEIYAYDSYAVSSDPSKVTFQITSSADPVAQVSRVSIAKPSVDTADGDKVKISINGTEVTTDALSANASEADIADALVTAINEDTTISADIVAELGLAAGAISVSEPTTSASVGDTVSVDINGHTVTATLVGGETAADIAQALAGAINNENAVNSDVEAEASADGVVTLRALEHRVAFTVGEVSLTGDVVAETATAAPRVAFTLTSKHAGKPFELGSLLIDGTVDFDSEIVTQTENETPDFFITASSTDPNVSQSFQIGENFGSQLFDFRNLGMRVTTTTNFAIEDVTDDNGIRSNLAGGEDVSRISNENNLVSYFYQVGSGTNSTDQIQVDVTSLTTRALGLEFLTLSASNENGVAHNGTENAGQANGVLESALQRLSTNRAKLGAKMNRLEFVADNLRIAQENNEQARSSVMDADTA